MSTLRITIGSLTVHGTHGRGGCTYKHVRGIHKTLTVSQQNHSCTMEWRGGVDSTWRLSSRCGLREPYELPKPLVKSCSIQEDLARLKFFFPMEEHVSPAN